MTAYINKDKAIVDLFSRWEGCTKCELGNLREGKSKNNSHAGNVVFGDGDVHADIVVMGGGPGEDEDVARCPFSGDHGDILDDYLSQVSMTRDDLFIINVVACRPFSNVADPRTKKDKEEAREPTPLEREMCRPLWQEAVYIVDPLIIVAMGKSAVSEVTGKRATSMRDVAGTVQTCKIRGRVTEAVYNVVPMYHPINLEKTGDTFRGGPWHQALVAWKRAILYLDQLRNLYRGTPIPDRGFKDEDMFLIGES